MSGSKLALKLGRLFVVPTPIGNMEDMTLRGLKVLRQVDYILTERKTTTLKLLRYYGLTKPLVTYREDNHSRVFHKVTHDIRQGKQIALVSEAGTPCIADPGARLIKDLYKMLIKAGRHINDVIHVLPGPSIVPTAVIGFPVSTHSFWFVGYLPRKTSQLRQELYSNIEIAEKFGIVLIALESVHRVLKTLKTLSELEQDGVYFHIGVGKELTKLHELRVWGTPTEVFELFKERQTDLVRGEFVIVIDPNAEKDTQQ